MKILDRYILSRFLYNFISSFVILMFIFIFQTIWLFIDDLAGRGLDLIIIGKFLFYLIPDLTEKVLPLTVLLSSILTFGTFAENYEFAAMKASGISLQRAMGSLIVFIVFLGGLTFFFANNVIPVSQQKIYNLRKNIARLKPAVAITEGMFSDFEGTGYNIKVAEKYGPNDRLLKDVIIHEKSATKVNQLVIKSEKGELKSSEDSDILQLVLENGHYYQEVASKSAKTKRKHPYAKGNFQFYTLNIDLSDFNNIDLEEDRNVDTDKMKNVSRLIKDIDSLGSSNYNEVTKFSKNITNRTGLFIPIYKKDTLNKKKAKEKEILPPETPVDTVTNVLHLFNDYQQIQIARAAKNSAENIANSVSGKKKDLQRRYKIYNMHVLSLHKKYALALSCVILFFVGAPLGAIIRKGGLGLPMVIAIVLFLIYYFIGVFAGNYAKEGNIHPIIGAWLPTAIMLPLGVSLTRRATRDRGLMSVGNVVDKIKALFKKKKQEDDAS